MLIREQTLELCGGTSLGRSLVALLVLACGSCSRDRAVESSTEPNTIAVQRASFDIAWPMREFRSETADQPALLEGELVARVAESESGEPAIHLRLQLNRPTDSESRTFWNNSLEYREHRWMTRVRVWDEDEQWLYPNLAYLFRIHGFERVERYGGWDPGKEVDNDFGAVLIRVYDAEGQLESPATVEQPLVSAKWYPLRGQEATRRTIVHSIRSDDFVVHTARQGPLSSGQIRVWFVYGDFMGHPVPKQWPQQPEHAGGTLAFFHVDWRQAEGRPVHLEIAQEIPPHTGFDWEAWSGRYAKDERVRAPSKLTDR